MVQYENSIVDSPAPVDRTGDDALIAPGGEPAAADNFQPLADWVIEKTDGWKTWRKTNYATNFDSWERLWRGVWSGDEKLRESERSKVVTPALSEAVENAAAEIEEATFGRGDYFDISPYATDDPLARDAVERARSALKEDLARVDFTSNVSECILNAAVYGTGIGEIVVEQITVKVPSRDPMTGTTSAQDTVLPLSTLRSVNPRNFLIDPNAKTVKDALGVAIEEHVSKHVVLQAQKSGVFRSGVDVCVGSKDDDELKNDRLGEQSEYTGDKVHLLRYYGLVPRKLLTPDAEAPVNLLPDEEPAPDNEDGDYVEAIVVLGNGNVVLKADANPYLMKDRPITVFRWDIVPGRFYGRGICEKGASSQRILDAEVRARLDSLALTTVPMMGMDVNRVPRGYKLDIQPGKSILTNGNPAEILHPFKFGQTDPNHWQNAQSLQAMVQQATGSIDATALAGNIGQARSGAVSMTMAPVIKRYKRTMIHFTDEFLMPALEKIVWRSMQYQPKRYPAVPMKFSAASTMGIMQREYETSQLTSLLQALPAGTPEHRSVLMGIVSNTSIPNREQLLKQIAAAEQREAQAAQMAMAQQQNPQAQQLQAVSVQLQMAKAQLDLAKTQAEIREIESNTALNAAKATQVAQENHLEAIRIAQKGLYNLDPDEQVAEFDRRYKLALLELKAGDLQEKRADRVSNEKISALQMGLSAMGNDRTRKLERALEHTKTFQGPPAANASQMPQALNPTQGY